MWIDIDVHRLPDGLVLPAYPALLALLLCATLGSGDWRRLLAALIAMAALFVLYFVMAMISPASLGFGDVKLSGLIGLLLGWLGLGTALLGLLAGFVAGGVIALVMLVGQRVGLRSHIAFGPAMLIGAVVALALEYQLVPGLRPKDPFPSRPGSAMICPWGAMCTTSRRATRTRRTCWAARGRTSRR